MRVFKRVLASFGKRQGSCPRVVIRSKWFSSDWWNKCNDNRLMNSSLKWPRGERRLALTSRWPHLFYFKSLVVTQIWKITLTWISERINERCCQVWGLLPSELLKMPDPAELSFWTQTGCSQLLYCSAVVIFSNAKLLVGNGTKRFKCA